MNSPPPLLRVLLLLLLASKNAAVASLWGSINHLINSGQTTAAATSAGQEAQPVLWHAAVPAGEAGQAAAAAGQAVQAAGQEEAALPGAKRRQGAKLNTSFTGRWELVRNSSGVSVMHLVITKENKAVMFDATHFGSTQIQLRPGNCRPDPTGKNRPDDCWAHAVEYDFVADKLRPLKVLTNTWCSSGGLAADGSLVQTGGFLDGGRAVRYLNTCATCDWVEYRTSLSVGRWYATQQILPDGSFIVVGGRREFSYEFVPAPGASNPSNFILRFLIETTDDVENNLYPFLHLSTDGTLFIFANNRSILFDPRSHSIVRELPPLPDGASHNYPASASSALLPLHLRRRPDDPVPAEVIICGGNTHNASTLAVQKKFLPALRSCARLTITDPNATWHTELMPTRRVMGDMLILPSADILLINGASNGTSGWGWAEVPNLEPLLYRPSALRGERFTRLTPGTIPRMYHATSAVLPDGSILVAGSNPNLHYNYTAEYPTEFRVEKFYPPYLDPALAQRRPAIERETTPSEVAYRETFAFEFSVAAAESRVLVRDLKVTMYAPPFTTHGYSMGQRMLLLRLAEVAPAVAARKWQVKVAAPPTASLAPPGYYMLFVVYRGVPSEGVWIRIH